MKKIFHKIRFLMKYGSPDIYRAIEDDNRDYLASYIKAGFSIEKKAYLPPFIPIAPLFRACAFKRVEMVEMLLKAGARHDTCHYLEAFMPFEDAPHDAQIWQLLHQYGMCTTQYCSKALMLGRLDIFKMINTDIGYLDEKGNNYLHLAAEYGHIPFIDYLAEHLYIDATNHAGETALHLASDAQCVQALLHLGAAPGINNHDGKIPFDYRVPYFRDIADIFIAHSHCMKELLVYETTIQAVIANNDYAMKNVHTHFGHINIYFGYSISAWRQSLEAIQRKINFLQLEDSLTHKSMNNSSRQIIKI